MLYDKTTIAVRERGAVEIADIAWHVIRDHWRPLLFFFSLLVLPMMVLNYVLIGWMSGTDYSDGLLIRYIWNMILLVAIEAQLVTVFSTFYLGQALFGQPMRLRDLVRDTWKICGRVFWCHGVVRAILAVWALYTVLMFYDYGSFNVLLEIFLIPLLVFYALVLRAFRPFVTELLTLERSEFRPRRPASVSLTTRSRSLHGPAASELFGRAILNCCIACMFPIALLGALLTILDIVVVIHDHSFWLNHVAFPLTLWATVGVLFVNRFLSYLDIRTRQEGWEVELKLRAEEVELEKHLYGIHGGGSHV